MASDISYLFFKCKLNWWRAIVWYDRKLQNSYLMVLVVRLFFQLLFPRSRMNFQSQCLSQHGWKSPLRAHWKWKFEHLQFLDDLANSICRGKIVWYSQKLQSSSWMHLVVRLFCIHERTFTIKKINRFFWNQNSEANPHFPEGSGWGKARVWSGLPVHTTTSATYQLWGTIFKDCCQWWTVFHITLEVSWFRQSTDWINW